MENETHSQTAPVTPPAASSETPDVATLVNAAITGHMKRFTEKTLPGLFESALKPIHEKFSAAPAPPATTVDPKKNPEYAALEQKMNDWEKKANESAQRAVAAESKQREDRAFNEVRANLSGKVLPEFQAIVAAHLFQVQRAVEYEEDGTPVFTMNRKTQFGDEPVRLPIKDGIEAWLKSDDAKPFIGAPGTSGASQKPRQGLSVSHQSAPFDASKATDEEKVVHAMATVAAIQNTRR